MSDIEEAEVAAPETSGDRRRSVSESVGQVFILL